MQPTFYIVTPARNAAKTLDATITSVLGQTGEFSLHYHVQDGGSTDGSVALLERWKRCLEDCPDFFGHPVKFTFTSEPDQGMYDAINSGFQALDIPEDAWMGWINADDSLWSGALQTVATLQASAPEARWLMGWPSSFDHQGRLRHCLKHVRYPRSVIACGLADGQHWRFVQQEGNFWRKSLWDQVGGLDPRFRLAGDWDLWRRFATFATPIHVQRQLGAFWIHPDQLSHDLSRYRAEMVPSSRLPFLWSAAVAEAVCDKEGQWRVRERTCRGIILRVFFYKILFWLWRNIKRR